MYETNFGVSSCFIYYIGCSRSTEKGQVGAEWWGAKGVAHIKCWRCWRKLGFRLIILQETSMGSLVGALYAIGYDAHTMDSLVRRQNWTFCWVIKYIVIISLSRRRRKQKKYLVSLPIKNNRRSKFHRDSSVGRIFTTCSRIWQSVTMIRWILRNCLSRLPAWRSNLVDGKEVVQDRGVLPLAMRASMAIPGLSLPCENGMVLVDGESQ